ncbi:MAG: thioredoxin domain-containing protein [Pyrinomonadaceae bacterium]
MKQQMKRMTLIAGALTALMAFMALNVAAQDSMMKDDKMAGEKMMIDHSKPTVAIIRADWCTACQKIEPTMNELMTQYKDRLNFVILDVTTDEKTAEAAKTARALGIGKLFEANKKKTSTVIVLGEKNKVLFKTTYNYDRDAYVRAFDDAVAKANSMSMKKHG